MAEEPTKGPSAIPTTDVKPEVDIGKNRAASPRQMSAKLPLSMLTTMEEPPPLENRVTTMVARFRANTVPNAEW
jgi:hypothetical protein